MGIEQGWDTADAVLDGVEAVIFDNDGTLVDSMPAHYSAWVHALTAYGITFPKSRFYALGGMPSATIIKLLASEQNVSPAPSAAAVNELRAAWRDEQGRGVAGAATGVACVLEVLREAQARGLKIAVASGGERVDVLGSLAAAGVVDGVEEEHWRKVFGAVVTSEDVSKGKPNPEGFLTAAQRLGVSPEKCIGFEDADLGLEALQTAGMRAVDVRMHKDYPLPDELKRLLSERIAS